MAVVFSFLVARFVCFGHNFESAWLSTFINYLLLNLSGLTVLFLDHLHELTIFYLADEGFHWSFSTGVNDPRPLLHRTFCSNFHWAY